MRLFVIQGAEKQGLQVARADRAIRRQQLTTLHV